MVLQGRFLQFAAKRACALRMESRCQDAPATGRKNSHLYAQHCRATGREAQTEKRMARREATRERDSSPVMDRLPGGGGDIMGGEDSFAAARAR